MTVNDLTITDADVGAGNFTVTVTFSAGDGHRRRSDADLRAGRCQHAVRRLGRLDRRNTTFTATYNVADANVVANGVTIDVTGAQDANGNAQTDYTALAEFNIDTGNPLGRQRDGERPVDHRRGHRRRHLHAHRCVRPGDGRRRSIRR